jgi:hypothetical protein
LEDKKEEEEEIDYLNPRGEIRDFNNFFLLLHILHFSNWVECVSFPALNWCWWRRRKKAIKDRAKNLKEKR